MFSRRLFRITVERRIFLIILAFGVLPMGLASFFAMKQIQSQTLMLGEKQLHESSTTYALDLFDQLDHAAWEMRLRFTGEIPNDGNGLVRSFVVHRYGPPLDRPLLSGQPEALRLTVAQGSATLEGLIDTERFFNGLGLVAAGVERCLLAAGAVIRCAGNLGPSEAEEGVIQASWRLPLASVYSTDLDLTVTSRQSRQSALRHLSPFSQLLPLLLVVVGIIGWTLTVLIRRRMAPLSDLESATVAIREGRYDTKVHIASDDEFERLGQAFNLMAHRLDRSFTKMQGLAEIDRSILDGNEVETVITRALRLADDYYGRRCIAYLWEEHVKQGRLLMLSGDALAVTPLCLLPPPGVERARVDARETLEQILGVRFHGSAPIRVDNTIMGELLIERGADSDEAFSTLAELADRISVAATSRTQARSLYRQANYDALTGLLNRQAFSDRVADAIRRAVRNEQRGAVLFLDLDRFKRVNDTEGHLVGDELLRAVAARLSREVRDTDTVSRLGGDEFAVIVPDCGSDARLAGLCRRIIEAISEPVEIARLHHQVDVSIGVSIFPDDGDDVGTLLMKADVAMYEAKSQTGSTFSFYDYTLNEENERRARIESGLRDALADGRLVLHYQPRLELASMRVSGVEGLMRWTGSDGQTYDPADFIPVAEETGLIHRFTELLIGQAAECLAGCRGAGVDPGRIALNISTRQFSRQGFARSFLAILESSELSPQDVEIEITESLFVEDPEHVVLELNKLREAGVRIALDDFGTGFSSLNMLRSLPLDIVKVDRSFIAPIREATDARRVTQKIIEMVAALDLEVVAEGVEHWQEVSLLERLGCQHVQGYVLEQPLPLPALIAYLERIHREGVRAGYRVVGSD